MKNWTHDELITIGRALNHNRRPGLIEYCIAERQAAHPRLTVDAYVLPLCFGEHRQGIRALVKYLVANAGCDVIGSSSIDLFGVTKNSFSLEGASTFRELHIGNRRRGIDALHWLAYLSLSFHRLPRVTQDFFDYFCGSLCSSLASVHFEHPVRKKEFVM